jgi:hypothetical protein
MYWLKYGIRDRCLLGLGAGCNYIHLRFLGRIAGVRRRVVPLSAVSSKHAVEESGEGRIVHSDPGEDFVAYSQQSARGSPDRHA